MLSQYCRVLLGVQVLTQSLLLPGGGGAPHDCPRVVSPDVTEGAPCQGIRVKAPPLHWSFSDNIPAERGCCIKAR